MRDYNNLKCIICDEDYGIITHRYGETDLYVWYCKRCFKNHLCICDMIGHVEY